MVLVETLHPAALPFENEDVPIGKPGRVDRIIEDFLLVFRFQFADFPDEFELHVGEISALRAVVMDMPNAVDDFDREQRSVD
jgi:hypothetical protein